MDRIARYEHIDTSPRFLAVDLQTMIYTHVLNKSGRGVTSPLDM